MALPALHSSADTRSITERVNAIIKNIYNLVIPVGAADTVLTSDGTALSWEALPTAADARLLQVVSTQTGAVATGTTVIPFDDTIPQQSTDGDQYMSLAITPKSATSTLTIDVVVNACGSVGTTVLIGALFQDSTADALAAAWQELASANFPVSLAFRHVMTSGTTSATTFKVRAGIINAGTTTFNGQSGGRILGGALASSIVIREVLP
jgi:hypothetical protein